MFSSVKEWFYERVITMTKKDLEILRNQHKENFDSSTNDDHPLGTWYELGWVDALEFVLKHFDELCEETHQDELIHRAVEEAKFCIRQYFQDKYRYDDEWTTEEIEERIQCAFNEGDAETLANSFIDSADGGIPDDEWCSNIVRNFYD